MMSLDSLCPSSIKVHPSETRVFPNLCCTRVARDGNCCRLKTDCIQVKNDLFMWWISGAAACRPLNWGGGGERIACVHSRMTVKRGISCCCRHQEWCSRNTDQAIHNSVEHCSLGVLSPFLKSIPTLVRYCHFGLSPVNYSDSVCSFAGMD